MATPRMRARVVCTFRVTIETLAPTSLLTSVDFPAFGAPITAMKAERLLIFHPHFFAHEERRRRGKTPEEAEAIHADAVALAAAGCYAIVIEAVDPEVSGRITAAVGVPTIGIAAGAETDGQVLVSTDLIGQLPEPPRFVTPKANVFQTVIDAGVAFAREVRGEVPAGTRS